MGFKITPGGTPVFIPEKSDPPAPLPSNLGQGSAGADFDAANEFAMLQDAANAAGINWQTGPAGTNVPYQAPEQSRWDKLWGNVTDAWDATGGRAVTGLSLIHI